jgi:hypothetical protein
LSATPTGGSTGTDAPTPTSTGTDGSTASTTPGEGTAQFAIVSWFQRNGRAARPLDPRRAFATREVRSAHVRLTLDWAKAVGDRLENQGVSFVVPG